MATEPYLSDVPLADPDADRLRRGPFAARIAETLASRSDPSSLVLGLYGKWGEGKTSVLRLVERSLEERDGVIVTRFNPWQFSSESELLVSFFAHLAGAIDRSLNTVGERIGKFMAKYGGLTSGLSFTFGDFRGGTGKAIEELGEKLAETTEAELRTRIESALEKEKKRVVVLVDDIDRLDRDQAQSLFRLLKVAADFRWTSYVLAMDDEVVAQSLAQRYSGRVDGGREFLEKIVQVPLRLPPAPPHLLFKFLADGLNKLFGDTGVELSDSETARLGRSLQLYLLPSVSTLRQVKRFLNVLQFVLPLARGEVNLVDMTLLEAIRVFRPSLYELIRRERRVLLEGANSLYQGEGKAEAAARLTELLEEGRAGSGDQALLEELFPRVQSILGNTDHGDSSEKRWRAQRRVASPSYYDRYFSAGCVPGQVTTGEINSWLDLAADDPAAAGKQLVELLKDSDLDSVVHHLARDGLELEGHRAFNVGRAIALGSEGVGALPRSYSDPLNPGFRLSLLSAALLAREPGERVGAIASALEPGDVPFDFVTRVLSRLRPSEAHEADDRPRDTLSVGEIERLFQVLLPRVRRELEAKWAYAFGIEAGRFLVFVLRAAGEAGEAREYLEQNMEAQPERAVDVVRHFAGGGWNLMTGLRIDDPLGDEGFGKLEALVSPDIVARALTAVFGDLGEGGRTGGLQVRSELELAQSFFAARARARGQASGARDAQSNEGPTE